MCGFTHVLKFVFVDFVFLCMFCENLSLELLNSCRRQSESSSSSSSESSSDSESSEDEVGPRDGDGQDSTTFGNTFAMGLEVRFQ